MDRTSWTTGVSIILDTDAEALSSSNIKGVKDWITTSATAFVIPWTIVEWVTMDCTVCMGGDDVIVVVVKDDIVVAVVVGLEVEATGAACKRLTRGARGPVGCEGQSIFLWGNKIETVQEREQAKQGQTRPDLWEWP